MPPIFASLGGIMSYQNHVDLAQKAISTIAEELLKQDVIISIEHDFEFRAQEMSKISGNKNGDIPIFDTRFNTLNKDTCFWIRARDRGNRTFIGTSAVKIFKNSIIKELFFNNSLLYDKTKEIGDHTISLNTDQIDHIHGNLAWIGSGWIHPDYRHRHIPALLMAFTQALLLMDYDIDFAFGAIFHRDAETGLGTRSYRFRHQHYGIEWHWPGKGILDLWLLYNTRNDIIRDLEQFMPKSQYRGWKIQLN